MPKPKQFQTVAIPVAALKQMRSRCAWAGCTETTPSGPIPKSWRWLALWWGPVSLPPWADGNIENRDCVLCPKHWRELDGLLEDIGNRLKKTQGEA